MGGRLVGGLALFNISDNGNSLADPDERLLGLVEISMMFQRRTMQ